MTTTHPRWQDLFTKLLQQEHHETAASEVEPYQAQPALGADLGLMWQEALMPGILLAADTPRIPNRYPSGWNSARYQQYGSLFPCCIGLAPQFLQKIDGIMSDAKAFLAQPHQPTTSSTSFEQTLETKSVYAQLALARLAGDAEAANRLIDQLDGEVLQKNERAAQFWLNGDRQSARDLWDDLPSKNPVVPFNQGIAALAAGETTRGRQCLHRAVEGFEEITGWNHLASLYLAVVE
jgi:hypothetical protein